MNIYKVVFQDDSVFFVTANDEVEAHSKGINLSVLQVWQNIDQLHPLFHRDLAEKLKKMNKKEGLKYLLATGHHRPLHDLTLSEATWS